jgi:hypothetical protein
VRNVVSCIKGRIFIESGNWVQKEACGYNKKEVTGGWENFHNEELNNLYFSN